MKHSLTIAFSVAILAVLASCASSDSSRARRAATARSEPTPVYFTGSGGRDIRLGILVPESTGLSESEAYLPRLVQGALVGNFSRFSAISVLDRVSLDRVIEETLDPTYEDNLDIVRLGHVAQVGHMMTGSIMRTSTGYMLQINVTDTTPAANTLASYIGNFSLAEMNDFSAVNRVSRELLSRMGVELTSVATETLNRASSPQDIGAQTSLAQGIVAQERGTIVEALVHYHSAVSFNPRLLEATDRLSVLSARVSSGNIGEDVRNEIQLRNQWHRVLTEAEDFFSTHLPVELHYFTSLFPGRIDFQTGAVQLHMGLAVELSTSASNAFHDILTGLEATERRGEWGWGRWPMIPAVHGRRIPIFTWVSGNNSGIARKDMVVEAVLLDENGVAISPVSTRRFSASVRWQEQLLFRPDWPEWWGTGHDTTRLLLTGGSYIIFNVNANDITDRITIRILSVNGVDVAQNPNFIRIVAHDGGEFIVIP